MGDDDISCLFSWCDDPHVAHDVAVEALTNAARSSNSATAEQIFRLYYRRFASEALPPPICTAAIRRHTNSRPLLVVLAASEIIKHLQDGSAQIRCSDTSIALLEWCDQGAKQGINFRLKR